VVTEILRRYHGPGRRPVVRHVRCISGGDNGVGRDLGEGGFGGRVGAAEKHAASFATVG
jgi:hypothetical protein